jgi:hypothetical protein
MESSGKFDFIDEKEFSFLLHFDGGGMLSVGFKDSIIGFGTGEDIPLSSPEFLIGIDESIAIRHSSGVSIMLQTFIPKESAHHDPTM